MSIGDKIKYLRELKGLSQYELGKYLNVKQQSIDKWEHSINNPRKNNIDKLANFFNVEAGFFFNDDFDTNKKDIEDKVNTSPNNSFIQPYLIKTENYLVEVSPAEFEMLNKFRCLSEKTKTKIEARIDAEYDIMKEAKAEKVKDA